MIHWFTLWCDQYHKFCIFSSRPNPVITPTHSHYPRCLSVGVVSSQQLAVFVNVALVFMTICVRLFFFGITLASILRSHSQ